LGFVVGFGDRGSCAGVIDEVLAGGDERGESEPVDGAGFAAAGLVDVGDGVIGEQRVGSADELEVVAEVAGGFIAGHAGYGPARGDALFERGQGTQGHLRRERGLAEKYCREGRFGVEPVVGQQPQRLRLFGPRGPVFGQTTECMVPAVVPYLCGQNDSLLARRPQSGREACRCPTRNL